MNDSEQREVFRLLKSIMPRTTDEQAMLCIQKVVKAPVGVVLQAVKTHAETEPEGRLSIPWIKNEVERILFYKNPRQKWEEAVKQKEAAAELIEEEKIAAEQSIGAAREFCKNHHDRLDEWRTEIVKDQPYLAGLTAGKETLKSTALVCAIYTKFGKIPVECGL